MPSSRNTVQFLTIEQAVLRRGLMLGDRCVTVPARPEGDGWAGIIVRIGPAPCLDSGLVGEHRWTSAPFEVGEVGVDTIRVGDEQLQIPDVDGAPAKVAILRCYELPVAQGRPPLIFAEVVLGSSLASVTDAAEQPAQYRALSFVALAGHGFSLVAPSSFERYRAGLDDGKAMYRFTTTDDGERLLGAGHFLPIWGIHQWDYRLVFCRGRLPEEERPLLGRRVLAPRHYPLDLGADGRLDVLPCVPQLQDVRHGLDRCACTLWPGKYTVQISGYTTGGYGVGLIPTYLLELLPYEGAAPDEILNGQSLPNLFEDGSDGDNVDEDGARLTGSVVP